MAAGDLLTKPGQIEWDGILFDTYPRGDYWLSEETELEGWAPLVDAEDLATSIGSAPGIAVAQAMYPTIVGLCVETRAAVGVLKAAMDPFTVTRRPLCWWDLADDTAYSAPALPRRFEAQTDDVAHLDHRIVDLMWIVPVPGDIEILDDES